MNPELKDLYEKKGIKPTTNKYITTITTSKIVSFKPLHILSLYTSFFQLY